MAFINDLLQDRFSISQVLLSFIILGIILLITRLINRKLASFNLDNNQLYRSRKTVNYIGSIIFVFALIFIWFRRVGSISTFLGLFSAGLAVALRDIIVNMVGWLFIIIRRPFWMGDRIEINGQKGDVIDIRLFQFSLVQLYDSNKGGQSTGSIIDIPNRFIFQYPLINDIKGFVYIWNELSIVLTFESDWRQAKTDFSAIVDHHALIFSADAEQEVKNAARKYMIYYNNFTPIVYTTVEPSGVNLTMRFLCDPRTRREIENNIWEEVLEYIASHDQVDLAYPTSRIVNKL